MGMVIVLAGVTDALAFAPPLPAGTVDLIVDTHVHNAFLDARISYTYPESAQHVDVAIHMWAPPPP